MGDEATAWPRTVGRRWIEEVRRPNDGRAVFAPHAPAVAAGKVVVRWPAAGTHRGALPGAEPTGRRVTFRGIEIVRVEGVRIAERWGE